MISIVFFLAVVILLLKLNMGNKENNTMTGSEFCEQPRNKGLGPQCNSDSSFTARMRLHQSWYRANVLNVPWGTGPGPNSSRERGSMLSRESGAKGLNFITPQIFKIAQSRIEDKRGVVEEFRLLHNMLSSQPMCFNLFGPLADDKKLATRILEQILPNEVKEVVDIKIEYAPEPKGEYLDDSTAFDAFIEFVRPDGNRGFIGIETKLTEPFSQKHYDGPAYRRWVEQTDSPWPEDAWPRLDDVRHNQLWRDHLLAVAMKKQSEAHYVCGFLMLVYHPEDKHCVETKNAYKNLLKPNDNTFLDYPLDKLVGIIKSALQDDSSRRWLTEFNKRYLDLSLSQ